MDLSSVSSFWTETEGIWFGSIKKKRLFYSRFDPNAVLHNNTAACFAVLTLRDAYRYSGYSKAIPHAHHRKYAIL